MASVLNKIKTIKQIAKIITLLNFILAFFSLLMLAFWNNTAFGFLMFFLAILGISNFVSWILLLVNVSSIYLYNVKDEEIKEIIHSYKITILVLTIIAFFFLFLIMYIIIWVISSGKESFLRETMTTKENEEKYPENINNLKSQNPVNKNSWNQD